MGKSRQSLSGIDKRAKVTCSSKLIGDLLITLGQQEIARSKKNPSTKEKWLTKMRLNIQRKVFDASSILFFEDTGSLDTDPISVRHEIARLQKVLENKCTEIRGRITDASKRYEGLLDDSVESRYMGKRSNQFDARISRITDKFSQVAGQVDSANVDLRNRLQSFHNSFHTVEQSLNISIPSLRNSAAGGAAGMASSSISVQGSVSMNALNQHLSRR
jgi:hypothetical protein